MASYKWRGGRSPRGGPPFTSTPLGRVERMGEPPLGGESEVKGGPRKKGEEAPLPDFAFTEFAHASRINVFPG